MSYEYIVGTTPFFHGNHAMSHNKSVTYFLRLSGLNGINKKYFHGFNVGSITP